LALLVRQLGMERGGTSARRWLTVLIVSHLVISIAHGFAHDQAEVPLSRAANLFVFIVILAGPLVGFVATWSAERLGSWIIAIAMAASLVFGLVQHFVVAGADRVDCIARQWRPFFVATAVLLASTEALGAVVAMGLARRRARLS
jgi:hypothetical protein